MVGLEGNSLRSAFVRLLLHLILVTAILGLVDYLFRGLLPPLTNRYPFLSLLISYRPYITTALILALGWLVISSFSNTLYLLLLPKYGRPASAAVRGVIRILGVGGLLTGIASGSSGGAVGVALGGFMGMVMGFASQQVLGQAVAGLFILIARPIRVDDVVDIAGEKKVKVMDVTTLFTVVKRGSGEVVLIPNNSIIGQKIVKYDS